MGSLNSSSSPFSSLQILPSSSSPSPSSSLVKFKAVLQTLILSLARAISRAKTTAFHILKQANHQYAIALKRNKKKLLYGSFRLHYNWCSVSSNYYNSHVTPPVITWDHEYSGGGGGGGDQLGGYLEWLEERENNNKIKNEEGVNEIDKLAEIFIARSHEKFKLEKQESYRRFQDMIG
ncbi:uncharacterized protein LOC120092033 [Benincasa hispida]|uniref:uncharacterized protein LOC120092033 n=1 Tax=Benincasa hispida TaxID=102211 RepID=UPI0018FFD1E2|nr:uncharacterized protein LOC120092033 [Benincasa hispida]